MFSFGSLGTGGSLGSFFAALLGYTPGVALTEMDGSTALTLMDGSTTLNTMT